MRVKGFVIVNGSTERVDWTINGDGSINEGPGLSAHGITVEGVMVAPEPEVIEFTDGYEDMTVTDLKVLLTQKDLPVYGNKGQLIERLRGWDANSPSDTVVEEVSAETEETLSEHDDMPGEEEPEANEGDVMDGSESE